MNVAYYCDNNNLSIYCAALTCMPLCFEPCLTYLLAKQLLRTLCKFDVINANCCCRWLLSVYSCCLFSFAVTTYLTSLCRPAFRAQISKLIRHGPQTKGSWGFLPFYVLCWNEDKSKRERHFVSDLERKDCILP